MTKNKFWVSGGKRFFIDYDEEEGLISEKCPTCGNNLLGPNIQIHRLLRLPNESSVISKLGEKAEQYLLKISAIQKKCEFCQHSSFLMPSMC